MSCYSLALTQHQQDATIDALDLVLDGVDTIWGWVAGSKEAGGRECQKSWKCVSVFAVLFTAVNRVRAVPLPCEASDHLVERLERL